MVEKVIAVERWQQNWGKINGNEYLIVDLEQKSGIDAYCRTKSARSKYISD